MASELFEQTFSSSTWMWAKVSISNAGNFDTPIRTPAPVVQLLSDAARPSNVEMPLITQK